MPNLGPGYKSHEEIPVDSCGHLLAFYFSNFKKLTRIEISAKIRKDYFIAKQWRYFAF